MLEKAIRDALMIHLDAGGPGGVARSLVEMTDGFAAEPDPGRRRLWSAAIQVTAGRLLAMTGGAQPSEQDHAAARKLLREHEPKEEMSMPIPVPKNVLDGLEAVRRSGRTNMLDRNAVIAIAMDMGFVDTAFWVDEHRREYAQGIFQGFVAEETGTENT